MNSTLLGKWVWRYAVERSAWWRTLIVAKCGEGPSLWQPVWNLRQTGLSVWKWIVLHSSSFWSHGYIDPRGGFCAFWFDFWVPGVRLSSLYPRIAAATQFLDSLVSDMFEVHDGRGWSIPLQVVLRGGALDEWNRLIQHLDSIPEDTITAGPASIVWPLELAGVFSVRSYRAALSVQRFPGSNHFPHDMVWSNIVPSKIQNFIWMVFHGKIATIDNLQRRGFHMVGRCVMCNRHYESVDHLFLGCDFSGTIWNRLSSALSLIGPFHDDVVSFLLAWKGMNCITNFKGVMKVLLHATFWCIWTERNHRIFREEFRSPIQILYKICSMVSSWLHVWGRWSSTMISDLHRIVFDNG